MGADKETPERRRERLKREELERNPTGNINDTFNRAGTGNLVDLGWKGTGILIVVIIVGFIVTSIIFK